MAGSDFDPGGSTSSGQVKAPVHLSYADRLKANIKYNQRLQRNILEIVLEKENSDVVINIKEEDTKQLFETIGIDIETELEGHQVKFDKVSVWLKQGVKLDKFCKDEKIRVQPGVTTRYIKPAGRNDVTVTIVGLNFNTPDTFVFEYIKNFGRIINNSVIYGKYSEGPFQGKFNGERRYQVDFSDDKIPMGTYHIIDGERVKVFYRGNKKTCARCHRFGEHCPGGGSAQDCEEAGGPKVSLASHMKELWGKLKFVPSNFELVAEMIEDNDVPICDRANFPPLVDKNYQSDTDPNKLTGLSINNFPLETLEDDICNFLLQTGGKSSKKYVKKAKFSKTRKNQIVTIEPLPASMITKFHEALNFPDTNEKHFGVPLYCRPIRRLTPNKLVKHDNGCDVEQAQESLAAATSTPHNEPTISLSNKGHALNMKTKKSGKSKQSGAFDPPDLESFEFSDYSDKSDSENFEDSRETQTSSDDDSEVCDSVRLKRQDGSPLTKEDFKRQKGSQRQKKSKSAATQ